MKTAKGRRLPLRINYVDSIDDDVTDSRDGGLNNIYKCHRIYSFASHIVMNPFMIDVLN